MRRLAKFLLPILGALAYAATATAYSIEVRHTSGGFAASESLVVDVWVDTGGGEAYGWIFWVLQDPTYLSASYAPSHLNPIPGQDVGSLYLYAAGNAWYIYQMAFAGNPSINQSVATLVFHVIQDLPSSFVIEPTFSYAGETGGFLEIITGTVVLTALHVPEPTPTMLLGFGLCLLAVLYAVGRQRRET